MKNLKQLLTLGVIAALVITSACKTQEQTTKTDNTMELKTRQDTFSYVLGMDIANFFSNNSFELNKEAFYKGFCDKYDGNEVLFSDEQAQELMMEFQKELQKLQQQKAQEESGKNQEAGKAFLADNLKEDGVQQTESGLQYKVLTEGTGIKPAATDKVEVHYEGTLIDGTVFDSSYERGETITFGLNQVIPGWTEGLQLMSEGSTYMLYIPSELGYGDRQAGKIPPGATLIFKVELIKVVKE